MQGPLGHTLRKSAVLGWIQQTKSLQVFEFQVLR